MQALARWKACDLEKHLQTSAHDDAVWTRVAFYTSDTSRLVLSNWKNLGPGNPHATKIHSWYFNDRRVGRALVLYWMNDLTWAKLGGLLTAELVVWCGGIEPPTS